MVLIPLLLKKKEPRPAPVEVELAELRREAPTGTGGIRCPLCAYRPKSTDRWQCSCGHLWNTFDTRGRCPACAFQWRETACPGCTRWSAHEAWYEPGPAAPR